MKIKQIRILDAAEHTNTFFSFQMLANETLKNLTLDISVTDVNIEYAAPSCIVISYSLDIDEEEGEIFS